MTVYLVNARLRVNVTGVEDVDKERLSSELDSFFDTAEFPASFEQPTYDDDGEMLEDEEETARMDVMQVDILDVEEAI
jgi:hypothetical protein